MSVPTYDQFIEPLLRFLVSQSAGVSARLAQQGAADVLGLTEQDRRVMLPSGGQLVYRNRAGWAHDRLKRAGLSSSPRRGLWQATPEGRAFLAASAAPWSAALVQSLAREFAVKRLRGDVEVHDETNRTDAGVPALSPDERLAEALAEIRQAAERDLLERLAGVSPGFFEVLVLDLLHRMGYGANRDDLQRVGGSGDGGIDGVISLDRLGLERVYVQAKRWQTSVGRPELQAFYGALAGQKAHKGVFITTSSFTAQAREFARSVEGMVLVDGERLAGLMIDHEVGVTARSVRIPRIDSDYFDEEGA